MVALVDIANRTMQVLGTRTLVQASELGPAGTPLTNEAKQFNLIYANMRDDLLRMAPWNCAKKTANLTLITAAPGTPENTSAATTLWSPGQPPPPWTYEYQYPVDCIRPCYIIPSTQTGFAGGVPITTAVTGGASSYWWGQPIRFRVETDNFFSVVSATVVAAGVNYAAGDIITLANQVTTNQTSNQIGTFNAGAPQGAPVQLLVTGVDGSQHITSVQVINIIAGASSPFGGSYYQIQPNPVAQASTSGVGTGATFNLTYNSTTTPTPQRVILTNQEFATLSYVQQVTDPNIMDSQFQTAWIKLNAAALIMALKEGGRQRANDLITQVNKAIEIARTNDGNEGLTVNDVTPDFLRVRGVAYADEGYLSGPYEGFEWGNFFPMF